MKNKKNRKGVFLLTIFIILTVCCFLYGFIVKLAGSGTTFFMVWIGLGLVFTFLGFGAYCGVWQVLPRFLKIVIIVMVSVGVLYFFWVESLICSQFNADGEPNLDYIIVLGAQIRESGPSVVLKNRLNRAIDYLEENPNTICIVSGGQGYNEPYSEAKGMADYLVEKGVNSERIILEDESKNTVQNIRFSKKKANLDGKTVGIVTNNFHAYRGVNVARKHGIPQAVAIASKSTRVYLPNNMLREFLGVTKDLIIR